MKNYIYKKTKKLFTMIELIISMAVFTVLMTVMMSFLSDAQNLWSQASSEARVFDNAKILMATIENDFEQMTACNWPGRRIPFYIDNGSQQYPTFVAAATLASKNSDFNCNLAEVSYRVDLADSNDKTSSFLRSVIDSSQSSFDCVSQSTDSKKISGESSWHSISDNDLHAVVEGVTGDEGNSNDRIRFRYYKLKRDDAKINNPRSNEYEEMKSGTYYHLPDVITVSVTLFDKSAGFSEKLQNKSKHTFTRMYYIEQGHWR